jgi:hypothetical protein
MSDLGIPFLFLLPVYSGMSFFFALRRHGGKAHHV